jgi:hypothetical protein
LTGGSSGYSRSERRKEELEGKEIPHQPEAAMERNPKPTRSLSLMPHPLRDTGELASSNSHLLGYRERSVSTHVFDETEELLIKSELVGSLDWLHAETMADSQTSSSKRCYYFLTQQVCPSDY